MLYPQFDLYFQDTTNQIRPIPQDTILEVTYTYGSKSIVDAPRSLNDSNRVRLSGFPEGIQAAQITDEGLVIEANVTLTYDDEGILNQFPARNAEGEEGVKVNGSSYLSYNSESLGGKPISAVGIKTYYRQAFDVATLTYTTAVPDNEQSSVNQLGINGLLGDSFNIRSVGYYSVAALKEATEADSMKCELEFYPKVDGGQYSEESVEVPYNASFQIELDGKACSGDKSGIIAFGDAKLNPDLPVTINNHLTIDTGSNFTGTYSNYMVKLTVSLWKEGSIIPGSTARDHIIYTNAKILTTLVEPVATTTP